MEPSQEAVFEDFAREFIRRHAAPRAPRPVARILVATDFSLCSLSALEYAEDLARRFGAELILVHVEEIILGNVEPMAGVRAAAERELSQAVQRLHADGLAARSLVRTGGAADEILRAADRERADLVVVGTHGRKGFARALLGSVAERVVRGAACPVLTVRDG
jgi:nucleotide-binding universal stress UspA family protein